MRKPCVGVFLGFSLGVNPEKVYDPESLVQFNELPPEKADKIKNAFKIVLFSKNSKAG